MIKMQQCFPTCRGWDSPSSLGHTAACRFCKQPERIVFLWFVIGSNAARQGMSGNQSRFTELIRGHTVLHQSFSELGWTIIFGTFSTQLFICRTFSLLPCSSHSLTKWPSAQCVWLCMGSRAPDPYGKDSELSQEYSFLFVLGTILALNCKYLCASKQSRACVRSIGSRGGGWGVGGQALLLWTMGRKQKTQKKKKKRKKYIAWFTGKIQLHYVPTGSRERWHWRDWHVLFLQPWLAPCFRSEGEQLALLPPHPLGIRRGSWCC